MAQLKSFFPLVSSAEVMTTCGITEAEIETRKVSFVFKSNFWTFFLNEMEVIHGVCKECHMKI